MRYISQVMTGKAITRSCEDVDITVLNAAEIKAIATDNPLLLEKMTAENEVTRLTILRKAWQNERMTLKRNIETGYPNKIKSLEGRIAAVKEDMQTVNAHPTKGDAFKITLENRTYDERGKAGQTLLARTRLLINDSSRSNSSAELEIGSFRGIKLFITCSYGVAKLEAKGAGFYSTELGESEIGNITRIENLFNGLRGILTDYETQRAETMAQLEAAKKEADAPFAYENELNEHSKRLTGINTKLEFKELADQDAVIEDENGASADKVTVSILDPEPAR